MMTDQTPAYVHYGILLDPHNITWFKNAAAPSSSSGASSSSSGPAFTALFGSLDSLDYDSANDIYVYTQADGTVYEFLSSSHPSRPRGFKSMTTPGGVTLEVTAESGLLITTVERSYTFDSTEITERIQYDYLESGENEDRVQYCTLQRRYGAMESWENVSRAFYTYHGEYSSSSSSPSSSSGPDEFYGFRGYLRSATRQRWNGTSWDDVGVCMYRYTNVSESKEPFVEIPPPLEYVVGPHAYELLEDDPKISDPLTATNAQVAQYADHHFLYTLAPSGWPYVSKEVINGGSQEFTFTYSRRSGSSSSSGSSGSSGSSVLGTIDDFNVWEYKTVETLPDSSQNIVYANVAGQTMLKIFKSGSDEWYEYYQYDDDGRLILRAEPSAVSGYDEQYDDLLHWTGSAYEYLRDSDGLIHLYEYYTTTGSGAAAGYLKLESIKNGESGSEIKLREYEYASHTEGDITVYPISKMIVYPDDSPQTTTIETSYAYTFHSGTVQVQQKTTTLPAIAAGQNGSGSANTRVEVFDIYGNLEWIKDERGYITRMAYNIETGAMTQRIDDVDTTQVTDEPGGWTTPGGGGLHLVTDYEHDDQGRITQVLGPSHSVDIASSATTVRTATWTVYKDADDEVWTASGYATGTAPSYTYTLVNPVSIMKHDKKGQVLEQIQATRASTSGKLLATDTFAQTSYVRWTTNQYTDCCKQASMRVYHTIPTSGDGSSGTNYDQTDYGYDSRDRRNRVVAPGGTITRTVFDERGNAVSVYVGTDDTGATASDPTGGGGGGNNMVLVTAYVYDGGADGGDNNLTSLTQHVDGSTTRVTTYAYDWRNRQTSTDGPEDFYEKRYYDNLNRTTKVERYDTTSGGNLTGRTETSFDDLGRVYQTVRHAVDPSSGSVGNSLTDKTWYDESGNVIKQHPAGSKAFTKTFYDGLGRATKRFVGYDTDETTYAEADDVTGDTLFEQTENTYDEAGNVLLITTRRRLHTATGTGELTTPGGAQPKARVSYVAMWPDVVGRTQATANYGTNGGSALTRPSTVPTRSDTILVMTTTFNDDGEGYKRIDPAGTEMREEFDDAGRRTKRIENYTDGDPTSGTSDQDRTVEFTYNADGLMATLTARQSSAPADQTTTYVHGTTLTKSGVARGDLLRAIIYPDSDDVDDPLGDGADGTYDRIEYAYNRQGQAITMKDQNGTVHAFDYDGLGRPTQDRVTTVGTEIDSDVLRIATTYEVRGMVEHRTSYDNATAGMGSVVNDVQFAYNDFGQLVTEYQAHAAAVDTGTSPKVQYAHADGSANHARLTKITYPDGRIVRYEYDSGDDDNLSRVSFLADDNMGAVGTHLAEYAYLGLGTIVQVDYTEPDLLFDLAHGAGDDPYDGLDRFDRVVDLLWDDYGSSSNAERVLHGYDRAGNRLWRENPVAQANSQDFDELYTYDGVYRLTDAERGDLTGTHDGLESSTLNFAQEWSLDALGNWTNFKEDTDGDTTWDLNQSRDHNNVNEITDIGETAGDSWFTPVYDAAGNMIKVPKP